MATPITLNGTPKEVRAQTLDELLVELKVSSPLVIVEHNGQVIAAEQRTTTPLGAGDRVEIITLMGGG